MNSDTDLISVATVGLAPDFIDRIEAEGIVVSRCGDLYCALDAIRNRHCTLVVLLQPDTWSLDRTGREVSAVVGDHAAIVLSPLGPAFAPGLFVVDHRISAQGLAALIERIARRSGTSTPVRPITPARHISLDRASLSFDAT